MLGKLKHTAKQTFIYSLGNISSKLIGFILLPLYTGYLQTEEYGIFAILEVTSTIMVAVLSFKLSTAMMRWCSSENIGDKAKSLLFTTYSSSFFIIILLNLTLQPFRESFSNLFFSTNIYSEYFLILLLSVSFEILNLFSFDLLRLKEKSFFYISASILRIVTILVLNIYFIKYVGLGVKGIILSQLIGNVLIYIITLPFIIKNMILKFDLPELKKMFQYGIPLIFSTISMMMITMGDRYIIKYFSNYSDVGIYSLGYKIASVTNVLIIQSFQTGFLPIAYKNFDKPDAQRFFSKILTYYTFVLVLASLGISLFSQEVIDLFSKNSDYNIAYTIVPFISLAFIFKGVQYVYSLGLHFAKKTKYNAYIVLCAAIINFIINILLIPRYGIYGAAVATIISWIIMSTAFYKFSFKYYKVKYEIKKVVLLIVTGIALYSISLFFNDFIFYTKIIAKSILIISFPFLLWIFRFYEKNELEILKGFVKKVFSRKISD
ncbi:MAG: oligosaccharide flippase family protein [Bacteroidales bacterium]|nr:oligosaccharide flippase family protein [Bacteroidales bacterium]